MAVKRTKEGYVKKLKARFVAHGFRQQYGKDYHSTYAPTIYKPTLRMLLSLACKRGMKFKQFDVTGAFLQAFLEHKIYLRPPKEVAKMLN